MNDNTNLATAPHPNRQRTADRALVGRMLQGDESAFREFIDRFKDRLFSAMYAHVGCRHEAEEIVQEAFVKAFQHLPRFQHQSQLYTWIYRIAWNTSVSRSRSGRGEISLDASTVETQSLAPEWSQPHVPIERRERVALLRRGLSEIENKHRRILILREFDEMSYQEISQMLDIPLGTVRSRIARFVGIKGKLSGVREG